VVFVEETPADPGPEAAKLAEKRHVPSRRATSLPAKRVTGKASPEAKSRASLDAKADKRSNKGNDEEDVFAASRRKSGNVEYSEKLLCLCLLGKSQRRKNMLSQSHTLGTHQTKYLSNI
jgi:hypothetical protein